MQCPISNVCRDVGPSYRIVPTQGQRKALTRCKLVPIVLVLFGWTGKSLERLRHKIRHFARQHGVPVLVRMLEIRSKIGDCLIIGWKCTSHERNKWIFFTTNRVRARLPVSFFYSYAGDQSKKNKKNLVRVHAPQSLSGSHLQTKNPEDSGCGID